MFFFKLECCAQHSCKLLQYFSVVGSVTVFSGRFGIKTVILSKKNSTIFSSGSAENAYVCIWANFPVDVLWIHVSSCTFYSFSGSSSASTCTTLSSLFRSFFLFFSSSHFFAEEPLLFWDISHNPFFLEACWCLPWMLLTHDFFCKQTIDIRVAQISHIVAERSV